MGQRGRGRGPGGSVCWAIGCECAFEPGTCKMACKWTESARELHSAGIGPGSTTPTMGRVCRQRWRCGALGQPLRVLTTSCPLPPHVLTGPCPQFCPPMCPHALAIRRSRYPAVSTASSMPTPTAAAAALVVPPCRGMCNAHPALPMPLPGGAVAQPRGAGQAPATPTQACARRVRPAAVMSRAASLTGAPMVRRQGQEPVGRQLARPCCCPVRPPQADLAAAARRHGRWLRRPCRLQRSTSRRAGRPGVCPSPAQPHLTCSLCCLIACLPVCLPA